MVNYSLQFVMFSWCILVSTPTTLQAQEPIKFQSMEQEFDRAMELLNSFKNDSANIVFTSLVEELSLAKELETHFGLKVRLRQAEALEKDHQNEVAVQKLLVIAEDAMNGNYWEVLTNANLSLARLHEKISRSEDCINYLRRAEYNIKKYKLDNLYPRFSNRIASYHRLFNNKDSALYYAQEALRTAPQFELEEEEAVGHLLIGLLLRDSVPDEAIQHLKIAGKRWKRVGDYSGYGAIMSNLSKIYLENQQAQLALSYSDSALIAFKSAAFKGNESLHIFYFSYKQRSNIFKDLGKLDSALHYASRGYELELEEAQQANHDKIVEIEAHYQDEQKTQKIEEQAQQIHFQKSRKNWLLGLSSVVIFFATMLTYYYFKLRAANKKTKQQTLAITKANEELSTSLKDQIALHGEVHHRVKNNLQVIISLLELQSEDIKDEKALASIETMSNRIYSMAAIHEMLYQKQGNRLINLLDYTQNLCSYFSRFVNQKNQPIFNIEIDNRYFNLETLMPIGMILNELLTNSLKYASTKENQLQIAISLERKSDDYHMIYRDNGPGFPQGVLAEREGGLGTYLLKSMSRQLNGKLISRNDNGAVYEIFFKEKNATNTNPIN